MIRPQGPLFNPTFLLRSQRPEDLPKMPPQLMVERFPTRLRDKHHMILAVPRGMMQRLDVWHDRLPLRETLSGSREGVCRFDSRSCQTLGVPRQSRGFTLGNYVWNYCQEVSLLAFRRDKTFLSAYDLHKLTAGTSKDLRLSADTIQQVCTEYATRRKQFKRGQRLGALPVARATGTQKPGYPLKAGHRYTTMVSGL